MAEIRASVTRGGANYWILRRKVYSHHYRSWAELPDVPYPSKARAQAALKAWKVEKQQNPEVGIRAQVRRLPTGEVQLKIPLSRNPASLKAAMKAVKKLGRRVKSVVVTGMKKRQWNPDSRPFYTIKKADIGKATIKAFGKRWSVVDFIGHIGPYDVGKRVVQTSPGVLQVENDAQMRQRLGL